MILKYPIALEIDISSRCNYSCRFCRNSHLDFSELDYDTICRLISDAASHNVFHLTISGGEPTLHPRFLEIVDYLGKTNLTWNLVTNGSTFSEDLVLKLKENHVNSITITLGGMTSNTDDFIKDKEGAFKKTIQAIDLCICNKVKLYIGYMITPQSCKEIPCLLRFLLGYQLLDDMVVVKIMKVKPWGAGKALNELFHVSHESFVRIYNEMKRDFPVRVIGGEAIQRVEDIKCMAGQVSCVVGSDGNVYPCVSFLGNTEFICGTIKETSVSDIWINSAVLKEFRAPRIFEKKCETCNMKINCTGGCRANAYNKYHDISRIDGDCCYV